ncbi:MAG: VIT1/CCC1 transporter family protein [Microbacteriaceae bacterium]|nr:VIT1/CCC1 transporter family protein [Microbacteriaceae bacterium]
MTSPPATSPAARADVLRWRRHLAAERAEARVYRDLASRRHGEEQAILLALADAEDRHAAHWIDLLGPAAQPEPRASLGTRVLGFFARRFGSVFVLALMQRAEVRSPYETDADATEAMAADERIHGEVVRALATAKRMKLAGGFRAAVFGMNDGLVSNLALVLGVGAAGMPPQALLLTGVAGLLAGALSMGAGEYVSVSSQQELIRASDPDPSAEQRIPALDLDANELALVYRARGMDEAAAREKADRVLARTRWRQEGGRTTSEGHTLAPALGTETASIPVVVAPEYDAVGSPWSAAISSFFSFAAGAVIPVLPYAFGAAGWLAVGLASGLVGVALLATGAITGLLSGTSPLLRALRQLAIGLGAAAATYLLGLAFGAVLGG